jgi:hypothetical protein
MILVENPPKKVKKYSLREPIHISSHAERERILGEHSDTVFACRDAGVNPPPPPLVAFSPESLTVSQLLRGQVISSSQKLYPCGDIWELYNFFDEQGNPLTFQSGYALPTSNPLEEVVEDMVEEAIQKEMTKELIDYDVEEIPEPDKEEDPQRTPMTEEEKRAERERYIRKVKKTIRRLVNLNRLYYMFTLSFALELNENVNGLRFILPEDDQRDREKVLDVWNSRLTDIRRWLKQKHGREFKFVMVLELHDSEETDPRKRGTYHVHLATDKDLDKHELQQHWGYGVVWIDDFRKTKVWNEKLKKHVNIDADFLKDPGRYMAKYLEKEIDNPKFLNKHAYSSSRRNLKRPEKAVIRDEKSIQRILHNPSLAFNCGEIPESVYKKIQQLKNIEEVETYDNLKVHGKLKKVEIPLRNKEKEGGKMVMYVRYRVFNFRLLYPQAKRRKPTSQMEFRLKDSFRNRNIS